MLIYWKEYQVKMIEKVKASENPLTIAGDGRHDSMGHSAKYCAYTTLCCTVPQIIHFSLVQVQLMHGIQSLYPILFRNQLIYKVPMFITVFLYLQMTI